MGTSRIMNLQRHRIAQCRSIVIRILGDEGGVPVQVDGEAWLHPPGIIRILHKNRVQLMCRDKVRKNRYFLRLDLSLTLFESPTHFVVILFYKGNGTTPQEWKYSSCVV